MEATDQTVMVMREESPLVTILSDSVAIFDRSGKIAASLADRDADGLFEHIDYRVRQGEGVGVADQWDADRDRCADFRFLDGPSGGQRKEAKERLGFYQHVGVDASDPEAAELEAVRIVQEESDLRTVTRNPRDDPPVLYVEEIDELEDSADVADVRHRPGVLPRDRGRGVVTKVLRVAV